MVGRRAQRWGRTAGPIDFHGGKVALERPRVRERGGKEVALPSWERAVGGDWLGRWAMNLMLIGVTTRRFGRARHPALPHHAAEDVQVVQAHRSI